MSAFKSWCYVKITLLILCYKLLNKYSGEGKKQMEGKERNKGMGDDSA